MTSWAIRRKSDGKFFKTNGSLPDFTDNPLKTYRTKAHALSAATSILAYGKLYMWCRPTPPVAADFEIVRLLTTVEEYEEIEE